MVSKLCIIICMIYLVGCTLPICYPNITYDNTINDNTEIKVERANFVPGMKCKINY